MINYQTGAKRRVAIGKALSPRETSPFGGVASERSRENNTRKSRRECEGLTINGELARGMKGAQKPRLLQVNLKTRSDRFWTFINDSYYLTNTIKNTNSLTWVLINTDCWSLSVSRNIIYTFSGNQLPAIDNKKNTEKWQSLPRMGWGGGGWQPWSYDRNLQKVSKGFLLFSVFKMLPTRCIITNPFNRFL